MERKKGRWNFSKDVTVCSPSFGMFNEIRDPLLPIKFEATISEIEGKDYLVSVMIQCALKSQNANTASLPYGYTFAASLSDIL